MLWRCLDIRIQKFPCPHVGYSNKFRRSSRCHSSICRYSVHVAADGFYFFYHFYTLSSKLQWGQNLLLSRQDRLIVWEELNSSACLKSIDIVIHTSSFHQTCENKIRLATLNFRGNFLKSRRCKRFHFYFYPRLTDPDHSVLSRENE